MERALRRGLENVNEAKDQSNQFSTRSEF